MRTHESDRHAMGTRRNEIAANAEQLSRLTVFTEAIRLPSGGEILVMTRKDARPTQAARIESPIAVWCVPRFALRAREVRMKSV
jgi:hypothetical protein